MVQCVRSESSALKTIWIRCGWRSGTAEIFLICVTAVPAGILKNGQWQSRRYPGLSWLLLPGDFLETMSTAPSPPDLIFYDMFSTKTSGFAARLLLDTMGSGSPIAAALTDGAAFGGVCPTVGTVARGFAAGDAPDEVDPTIGDVLISIADAVGGRQHIWEAFPGREDEVTVYLFYYP